MKEKVFLKIVSLFQLGKENQNMIAEEKKYKDSIVNALESISKNDVDCIFQLFSEPQYRDLIRGFLIIYACLESIQSNAIKDSTPEKYLGILTEFLIQDITEGGVLKIYDERAVSNCLNEIFQNIWRYVDRQFLVECQGILLKFLTKFSNYAKNNEKNPIKALKSFYFKNGYKPFSNDFNNQKTEYEQLLKAANKEARVYLLGEFNLDEFYIRPKLKTGIWPFSYLDLGKSLLFTNYLLGKYEESIVEDTEINERDTKFIDNNSFYERFMSRFHISLSKDCRWNEIFKKNNVIYLVGGPGYGKTLFLKNLICHFDELKIFDSEEYLVIHADCKDYEYILNRQEGSLIENLSHLVHWFHPIEFESINGMLNYYITRGRCIILFDALDEVNFDRRENVHTSILNAVQLINPSNLVCIVSRERGFDTEKGKTIFQIPPLKKNDIILYVERMVALKKFKKDDAEDFFKQAKPLMEQGLLNSFLILSLLVNIYNGESSLPETKLELYQKCYEYIFLKREDKIFKSKDYREEGLLEEKRKTLKSIMRPNTFYELARMCTPNNNDISRDRIEAELVPIYTNTYGTANEALYAVELFLKFCAERTELFVLSGTFSNDEMVSDQYRFFHRAFCEYFYSQYIYTRENLPDKIYYHLAKLSGDSEVYELLLNTLKNQKQEIYEALILLMLDKMESESTEERKTAVNIFSICFNSIIEEHFRNRFICFLKCNAEWVVTNITCIMYQEEIATYICYARDYEGKGWNKKEISSVYKVFHQINVLTGFINQYPQALALIHGDLELEKYEKKIKQAGRNRFLKYFYDIVCEEQEGIKSFIIKLNTYKVNSLLKYSKTDNESIVKNTKYATMLGLSRSDIEKLKKEYKNYFEHTSTDEREALAEMYDCD